MDILLKYFDGYFPQKVQLSLPSELAALRKNAGNVQVCNSPSFFFLKKIPLLAEGVRMSPAFRIRLADSFKRNGLLLAALFLNQSTAFYTFLKAQTRLPLPLFSGKLRRLFSQQKGNKLSRF